MAKVARASGAAQGPSDGAARDGEAATREVLDIIARSRDNEQPVFDAILRNAARLCRASRARLQLVDAEREHFTLTAMWGGDLKSFKIGDRLPLAADRIVPTSIREARTIHVADLAQDADYLAGDPVLARLVDAEGLRTLLAVPLVKDGAALGCISLSRDAPDAFAGADIALVETFATQAVIAIENARQFREVRTRLDRERASRDVLQIVSRSRDDEKPVFDAVLAAVSRLCRAPLAFLATPNEARSHARVPASLGARPEFAAILEAFEEPLENSALVAVRPISEARVIHIPDAKDDDLYRSGEPRRLQLVDVEGVRTILGVPLLSGDRAVGALILYRREVVPFTPDEIALVESFAEQAVIAIENVRQHRELQQRLEREAATNEVLGAISRSRSDETPVFNVILESACRLCETPIARLYLATKDDPHLILAGHRGEMIGGPEDVMRRPPPNDPNEAYAAEAIAKAQVIHVHDLADTDKYRERHEWVVSRVEEQGVRTILFVPLIRGDAAMGVVIVYRREVRPFSESQIALLETFAAQAVIAIENVRQFRALEASNAEVRAQAEELQSLNEGLESRVAEQVGEIERMGRLKRFLSPAVADAVVNSGADRLLSSHRALIAVLFCDIRGFTAFCETAEPEETIEVLQRYHEAMGALLAEHGAGVDHRSGDGIMAIFNDPLPCDDPAGDALRMALAMRSRMEGLCADWRKLGHRLGFGVGVSLGYATVGMVGSEGRYDYTASGTTVNLAARLCDHAGDGDILLSPRAFRAVEAVVEAEPFGELTLKGISAPVDAFRVTALR